MKTRKYTQQPIGLTLSKQNFKTRLQRVLYYLILNQIQKGCGVQYDIYHNLEINIPVELLNESNWKRVKQVVSDITSSEFVEVNEKLKVVESVRPFYKARYEKGVISVKLANECIPFIVELSHGYSQYQFDIMQSLTGKYSQRMYEIISGKKNLKGGVWREVPLDYLKYITVGDVDIPNKKFMERVIKNPQDEFIAKADTRFEVEKNMVGRKIVSLDLHIDQLTEKEIIYEEVYADYAEIEGLDNVQKANVYNSILKEYSFTKAQQTKILTSGELIDKFYKTNKLIESGFYNPKDQTAYMAKTLGFSKK